ncbi:MAG TPA: hypothetical protein VKY92_12200 [Verrucomicrobiae bacterium]|nr:hypothetical protein [Verrucomicrobiae bacterium]
MAIDALGRLGNQALPPLLNAWSNSVDQNDRWRIQYAVVINLKPDVRDTNLVPLLLATINQSRQQSVRTAASNALFQIAPNLLTNTPPQ